MSILITLFIGFSTVILFRILFDKWLNPISIYTLIWVTMIVLYEIRLMSYIPLRSETWIVIGSTYLFLVLGSLTVFSAKSLVNDSEKIFNKSLVLSSIFFKNNAKVLLYLIIILSLFGLISTLQHWYSLIKEFGSIEGVMLQAAIIYQMRVEGEIGTGIPYIFAGVHMALFISGIYSAYKNKFGLVVIFPFLILIFKSLAEVSRAGMLLGLLEFFIAFIFFKQYLAISRTIPKRANKGIIIGIILVFIFVIAGATAVKIFRAPFESYKASSSSLNKFEKGIIFSPTIYLYMSSHIGVLNKYLESQNEKNYFGEVTFFPFYRLVSKFDVIKEPTYYQKGYFIPMWSNTGTFIRDIHADFGYTGLFLIPFLLGISSTFYWIRFYQKQKFIDIIILSYLTIILAFSFLLMATRFGNWLISIVGFIFIIPLIEKYYNRAKQTENTLLPSN